LQPRKADNNGTKNPTPIAEKDSHKIDQPQGNKTNRQKYRGLKKQPMTDNKPSAATLEAKLKGISGPINNFTKFEREPYPQRGEKNY